jgi:hypothetical protein
VLITDDNVRDLVEARVVAGELRLGTRAGVSFRNVTLRADVTVPHLERVRASGASQVVIADELAGEELTVGLSGASRLDGAVRAERATFELSGASSVSFSGTVGELTLEGSGGSRFDLDELTVSSADVQLSGASRVDLGETEELRADLSGASALVYGGEPDILRADTSGASSIRRR